MGLPACSVVIVLVFVPLFAPEISGVSLYPWKRCGPVCDMACPCGKELDYKGCEICSCKSCRTPPFKPDCGEVCAVRCDCGVFTDYRGCPTCRCKPCEPIKPCPMCCGPPPCCSYCGLDRFFLKE